ncbi:MAG: hypothetical protein HY782_21660 [Chloroflexi bacterium]|nr:hypothetical protein [Chloroflexota bacterium]
MPSLVDLQFLSGSGVVVGLIVSAACVVLIADWRLALFALALEYVLLGLLLATIIHPSVALVRIIAGALAAAILYLTMRSRAEDQRKAFWAARRASPGDRSAIPRTQVFIVGLPFRFFAVALVAVTIIGFASSMTLLSLRPYLLFSSLWLMAIGLLVAMLSRDTLRLGLGILVFTSGFSVLDTAIETSLFLYGLLNIADLLIALAIAHLATLPSEKEDTRRRGDLP